MKIFTDSYESAEKVLDGKKRKKVGNNTYLEVKDDSIAVRLHDTHVVKYFKSGDIVLNTGGFNTHTTRDRINSYTPNEISVHTKNHILKLKVSENTYNFQDGIIVNTETFEVIGEASEEQVKSKKELIKKINKYAKNFSEALPIERPSGGDCWHCCGNSGGKKHLLSHIEEDYYVPSLLVNALKESGYRNVFIALIFDRGFVEQGWKDNANRAIRKYMRDRLVNEKGGE